MPNTTTIKLKSYRNILVLAALVGLCNGNVWADEAIFAAAKACADDLISAFEKALEGKGDVRQAALDLQKDPIAVVSVNEGKGDVLKTRINQELNAIKENAKASTRQQIADHYGVPLEDVT